HPGRVPLFPSCWGRGTLGGFPSSPPVSGQQCMQAACGDGDLVDRHAEVGHGILDRVGDDGRAGNGAALTDTLDAERVDHRGVHAWGVGSGPPGSALDLTAACASRPSGSARSGRPATNARLPSMRTSSGAHSSNSAATRAALVRTSRAAPATAGPALAATRLPP